MSTPTFQLDPAIFASVAAKAIFETLDSGQRDLIVQQAIEHLVTPPTKTGGFSSYQPPTPIQVAFNDAVQRVAADVVRERLVDDAVLRGRIEDFLRPPFDALMRNDIELASSLSHAIANALMDWARERR